MTEFEAKEEAKMAQERMYETMKDMERKLKEQKEMINDFVAEKPLIALGMVFLAGLTLGTLAALMARSKD